MMSDDMDQATIAVCDGETVVRWRYTVETGDAAFPLTSDGQLLLRTDGFVLQRDYFSSDGEFGPWHHADRATDGGPYTAEDVERVFQAPGTHYRISRIVDQLTGW